MGWVLDVVAMMDREQFKRGGEQKGRRLWSAGLYRGRERQRHPALPATGATMWVYVGNNVGNGSK